MINKNKYYALVMNICCGAAQLIKDRNLNSHSAAILFLNENDSPVSIKPLKSQSVTLKPAADTQREPLSCLESTFNHSIISVLQSYYHRST